MYDVLIIGGGVIGCSLARELARYDAKIVVAEKENDVATGTSKANSGIVHAGFDAKTGSNKAKYNVLGAGMFEELSKQLDFPYRKNGAFVLCFDKDDEPKLQDLLNQGVKNGVKDLRIVSGEEARRLEPNISKEVTAALYIPTSGIVSPYEMTVAYAENAFVNGAEFLLEKEVTDIKQKDGVFEVTLNNEKVCAKSVVNCAGVYADVINNLVSKNKLEIISRKGEYCLLDKKCGGLTDATLFQLPTKMGKGILVAPTTHGNILVGPTADDIDNKSDVDTTYDGLNTAFDKASISVPSLNRRNIITQFAGLRAHCTQNDFVIGESDVKNFYNVAGIESPGLTSAPAIAVDMASKIAANLGLNKKQSFAETRKGIPHFALMSDSEREQLIKENCLYGKIVCRCENVTEGEIVDSINRPLGATDMDGVKRRTRAGMGRCQAGFCTPRVMEILARELGKDMTEITKNGKGSNLVVGRTK